MMPIVSESHRQAPVAERSAVYRLKRSTLPSRADLIEEPLRHRLTASERCQHRKRNGKSNLAGFPRVVESRNLRIADRGVAREATQSSGKRKATPYSYNETKKTARE